MALVEKKKKRKKRKKLKVGSKVYWDKIGAYKRGGLMAGPGKIESIDGKNAVFICGSLIGGGTFRETVPLKQLVPA